MKFQNNLYNLIKSLSLSEKGYFRKHSQRHTIGEKNIYLRLFEEIDKLKGFEEYNENELKSKLKRHSNTGNFSMLKNYLYEMILKSMRAYDSQKEIDSAINSHIENFLFLKKKNLIKECEAELGKAKKLSLSFERFEKLLEILKNERVLTSKKNPVDSVSMTEIYKEFESVHQKIKCNAQYRHLNDIAFANLHRDGKNLKLLEKNFKEILNDPLLKDVRRAITFEAKLSFYQIYSAYYYALSEWEKVLEIYNKILNVMEDYPVILKEYTKGYLIILHNCADVCDQLNRKSESKKYNNRIDEFISNPSNKISGEVRHFLFASFGTAKIINLMAEGKYENENQEIRKLEKEFLKNMEFIHLTGRIFLMFQFSMYFFGCKDYDSSLKWLHMIINKDEELRSDLRIESKLLFLIIQFELNNYDLIQYAVKSTQRYLLKKEPLMGIEPIILSFIRKMSNIKNPDDLKKLFTEFKDTLVKNQKILDEYAFDYLSWVESKILKKSFAEIRRDKYLKDKNLM
ncbi:MAG: hypothetical protein M3R36_02175 [Bacteroidota bacterium]|nr:hypothetical protein [Bacteroidota bacterium]